MTNKKQPTAAWAVLELKKVIVKELQLTRRTADCAYCIADGCRIHLDPSMVHTTREEAVAHAVAILKERAAEIDRQIGEVRR